MKDIYMLEYKGCFWVWKGEPSNKPPLHAQGYYHKQNAMRKMLMLRDGEKLYYRSALHMEV